MNEDERYRECEDEDGIRVVRELRMVSDAVWPGDLGCGLYRSGSLDRDFEMEMSPRRGSVATNGAGVNRVRNTSIEWDLGDWEFPDYKERMNVPV